MSSHFSTPEHALRKAHDLLDMGRDDNAAEVLRTILVNKRYRQWQPVLEQTMLLFVKVASKLRKNVRDAFIRFRQLCATNQASLEKVLRLYQAETEAHCAAAQKKAIAQAAEAKETMDDVAEQADAVADEDDDEDDAGGLAPEVLMLKAMSGDDNQALVDKEVLAPWLQYMYDMYRTVLEVLRNNARLQPLYHEAARTAMDHCVEFKRHRGFRRVCELLRKHLAYVKDYNVPTQTNTINLAAPETQNLFLQTRFKQLQAASDLELWQEAYRTIEDIHTAKTMSHIPPPPKLMVMFYEKLADIFWASNNELFHSYCLEKSMRLRLALQNRRKQRQYSDEKKQHDDDDDESPAEEKSAEELAKAVLVSTMCIPPTLRVGDQEFAHEVNNDGNIKLASMLGFRRGSPTRSRLLRDLVTSNVLSVVPQSLRTLYDRLEVRFGPLTLAKDVAGPLEELSKDAVLGKYVPLLKRLVVLRVAQQLGKVFKTLRVERFHKLIPADMDWYDIERMLMDAVASDQLSLRLDHRLNMLRFDDGGLEARRLKTQLVDLAGKLQVVVDKINPPSSEDMAEVRVHVFEAVAAGVEEERNQVFEREALIERRKQSGERQALERRRKEEAQRQAERRKQLEDEARRMKEDAERRERERQKAIEDARARQEKLELIATIKERLPEGSTGRVAKKVADLEANVDNIDMAKIVAVKNEVIEAEEEERLRRQRELERRVDYYVRAVRTEERPVFERLWREELEAEEKEMAGRREEFIKEQRDAHARALSEKARLAKARPHAQPFIDKIMKRRRKVFEAQRAEQERRLEARREQQRRKAEKRARAEAALAALERERLAKEAKKMEEEEKARREREEAEREEAEREEAERLGRGNDDRPARYRPTFRREERDDDDRGNDDRPARYRPSFRREERDDDDRGNDDRPARYRPSFRREERDDDDRGSKPSGGSAYRPPSRRQPSAAAASSSSSSASASSSYRPPMRRRQPQGQDHSERRHRQPQEQSTSGSSSSNNNNNNSGSSAAASSGGKYIPKWKRDRMQQQRQ